MASCHEYMDLRQSSKPVSLRKLVLEKQQKKPDIHHDDSFQYSTMLRTRYNEIHCIPILFTD